MMNVRLAGRLNVWHFENFNVAIFWDTTNVINVKLCMVVLLIVLFLIMPPSVTHTLFHGHSIVSY